MTYSVTRRESVWVETTQSQKEATALNLRQTERWRLFFRGQQRELLQWDAHQAYSGYRWPLLDITECPRKLCFQESNCKLGWVHSYVCIWAGFISTVQIIERKTERAKLMEIKQINQTKQTPKPKETKVVLLVCPKHLGSLGNSSPPLHWNVIRTHIHTHVRARIYTIYFQKNTLITENFSFSGEENRVWGQKGTHCWNFLPCIYNQF